MGVFTFFSSLALVSLAISFEAVAARPGHKHQMIPRHNRHGQPVPFPVMTITTTVHSVFTTHVPIGNTSPAIANTPVPDVNTFVPHANTIVPSVNVIPHVSRHKNATTVTVPYNLPTTIVTVPRSTIPSVPSVAPGAGAYTLVKDYSSSSFFDEFNFFSGEDPTHGFVDYVDQSTAASSGLISSSGGVAYMYSNSKDVQPNGRSSVRLESKDTYNEVLIIGDFTHIPAAVCGTWPAFWTASLNNWPSGGEIDILEGVNLDKANHVALHTTEGCIVSQNVQSGTFDTMNCDVNAAGQPANAGCGGYTQANATYGDGMNALGGGVFAVDWTASAIRVYQFARPDIPADILAGTPNPSLWGIPAFDFSGPSTNIPAHFNNHKIIFDTTFCGDWAGNTFNQCGCPGTCSDFVANNPTAFKDVYWGIKNLSVYKAN